MKVETKKPDRVSQGDIYKDVDWIEDVEESEGVLTIRKIRFPYVIVLTQDCDLAQDFELRWRGAEGDNQDKFLISVLVAPIYNVDHVYNGEHLSELGLTMAQINKGKTPGDCLRQNKNPRKYSQG